MDALQARHVDEPGALAAGAFLAALVGGLITGTRFAVTPPNPNVSVVASYDWMAAAVCIATDATNR